MQHEYIEDYTNKVNHKSAELEGKDYMKMDWDELKAIDQSLREEFKAIGESFRTKNYSIKANRVQLGHLVKFFQEDVYWKGRQAFGVAEITKILVTQYKKYHKDYKEQDRNTKHFLLNINEMEGIMHFLAQFEGYGQTEAQDFVTKIGNHTMMNISKKIDDAKIEFDRMQEIEVEIQAMKPFMLAKIEGIDLAAEIKDITGETGTETPIIKLATEDEIVTEKDSE